MDVSGIGVDIVEIDRMRTVLKRTPSFRDRIFTEGERGYCEKKADPSIHYALRFAAKEAVMKALGTGMVGIGFQEIEVENDAYGKPSIVLHGAAQELAGKQGVHEMHLSLSYTHSVGVANVVAVTDENMPHPETKVDPREELARAFKAARTMLDEMPDTEADDAEGRDAGKTASVQAEDIATEVDAGEEASIEEDDVTAVSLSGEQDAAAEVPAEGEDR